MREGELQQGIQAVAGWLDRGSSPAHRAISTDRRPPRGWTHDRRARLLAAAAVVVALLGVGAAVLRSWEDPDGVVTAGESDDPSGEQGANPTTTTTDPRSGDTVPAPPTSSWAGTPFGELPPSGIAVVQDRELILHDFDGRRLATATTPAIDQLGAGVLRLLVAVRPSETVDVVAADLADVPPGCSTAATDGGLRVAVCGEASSSRQQIESISPTGERRVLSGAAGAGAASGMWQTAVPSPDGRWVQATWAGECGSTAFLLPADGHEPARAFNELVSIVPTAESTGIGWSADGHAIVQVGAGGCEATVDQPGIYLLDPDSRDHRLLIPQSQPRAGTHLWVTRTYGNDAEWIFATAVARLGLDACCGEPSHGGLGLTSGARWGGADISVGATPPDSASTLSTDLVQRLEPIELDAAPAVQGSTEIGPLVAYTCGSRMWTFGAAGFGEPPSASAVRELASAVLPYLGCTVGDRPALATSNQ